MAAFWIMLSVIFVYEMFKIVIYLKVLHKNICMWYINRTMNSLCQEHALKWCLQHVGHLDRVLQCPLLDSWRVLHIVNRSFMDSNSIHELSTLLITHIVKEAHRIASICMLDSSIWSGQNCSFVSFTTNCKFLSELNCRTIGQFHHAYK